MRFLRRTYLYRVAALVYWAARSGHLGRLLLELVEYFSVKRIRGRWRDRAFDRKYGTDTSGVIKSELLDLEPEKQAVAHKYQTLSVERVRSVLSSLDIDYPEHVFVDVGAGKGRPLLLASLLPFKAVIGVELSESLCTTARKNINRFRDPGQRCRDLSVVCADAMTYRFPDENLVVMMVNPFARVVLESVAENLIAARRRGGKAIHIVYYSDLYQSVLPGYAEIRERSNDGCFYHYVID